MRTTLDIDDEILAAAKDLARRRQTTAGAVISELVRRALTEVPAPRTCEPEPFYGFRPLAAGNRVVSAETVERLRDEEAI